MHLPRSYWKRKTFRGVSSTHSQHILEEYGVLLPVGTGVCYQCYLKLPKQDCMNEENLQSFSQELSVAEFAEDEGQFYKLGEEQVFKNTVTLQPQDKGATLFGNSQSCTDDAVVDSDFQSINTSSSQPLSQISSWSEENIDTVLTDLNDAIDVLGHGKISPIKYRVRRDLDLLQPSSLRTVKRKAGETINLFLDAIAPGQSTKLLKILQEPDSKGDTGNLHEVVLNLYMESSDRSLKKQLLSMIAHSHTKSELQQLIPGVTVHAIDEARKHATKIGAGMSVPSKETAKRQKMDREKLDHALDFFFDPTFHQITAFGTKEMKLSSGTLLTIPNVVRTAYHSTLVETYLSYCSETSFDPLCKSSLYKILSECPASRRTNLKGLDNIAADGNSAYDTLMDVIGVLENQSIGRSNAILKECKEKLQSSKLYLKTEYKLHLERESRCPDHCINFALSDKTNRNLTSQCCNHDHDMSCDRCNDFDEAISMLRSFVLGNGDLSIEKQQELEHDLSTSESAVLDWKCHIVRLVAQDSFRKEKLQNLKNGEVMVVMDWAMKFLPLLFREKQSDWFGQKGLNWHVTVCVFKDYENQLKMASRTDAKIAHMRAKLRKYVSNGGNISCSEDMKKALDDGEGVPGCHIAHVEIPQPVDQFTLHRKIKGITKISNVQFENCGQLKYWRNYNIGDGQIMSVTPINLESTLNILSDFKVPCKDTGNILAAREKQPSEESQSDVNLTCLEPNCNTVLHSYSELNDHCFVGIHHYMSTFDGIKMKWHDIC
ncbi:unnamed protein product [Mytilus coruscus]|uniref:C2H2-type domain-containing protein n=1 Tax=Mytilus coruscus TaxID=42192 RepID=A0A6J8BIL1_MYTCO|nr:unnamed protein product [Mytilus coruscus]